MAQDLASRILAEHRSATAALAGEAAQRRQLIEQLTALGLPSSRDENWKYANLRPLERVCFAPPSARPAIDALRPHLPEPFAGYARYAFIDGRYSAELSVPTPAVRVEALPTDPEHASALSVDDRFALLNEAFAPAAVALSVARHRSACIELVFVASTAGESAAAYPRTELRIAEGAQLNLIEQHVSALSDANFVNAAMSVRLAPGAQLRHYRLQHLGARALWLDTLSAALEAGAGYWMHGISLGAASARSTLEVRILGERAAVGLALASVAGGRQTHDALARVEHVAPEARTEQVFRGIAAERARVAFNGKIVVGAGARGTDSRQSLRGLLAGPEAEIDVRPQLEIYTDEVRCSHGATAGKLDETMLFYLLTRGLEPEVAQQLLKWAFLEDVVASIGVPELRRRIERGLVGQLRESQALKELL